MSESKPHILVVDDESGIRTSLTTALEDDYLVREAVDGQSALDILEKEAFSVVLLDHSMPGKSGEEVLSAIKATWPDTEVIMVTGVKDVDQAVRCMKMGAYDYLSKPWDLIELMAQVRRAIEKWTLARENAIYRSQGEDAQRTSHDILGSSEVMAELRTRITKVAAHDTTVLIQGESGTGKELVAKNIHNQSDRKKGRFVAICCAAIPESLVESELFGHEKGAFSSAVNARVGKFEYASNGTLLLDDVAVLPLPVQAKLLRVLQEREITRLGSNQVLPVNVRVLSSTNQDLQVLVKKGLFREDLYWRLCGVPIHVPALRDRGSDLVELFKFFVQRSAAAFGRKAPIVPETVIAALRAHSFPGNVRELLNLAETLVVLCENGEVSVSALPVQLLLNRADGPASKVEHVPIKQAVHEFERQLILRTLKAVNGNQSRASRQLGIHRNTLILKMQELGIPNKRQANTKV